MELETKLDATARQQGCGPWSAKERRSTARSNPVILSVDDEPDLLTILRLSLAAEGFEVITASNAAEALQLAEKQRPDIIITDQAMPGMSGLELCRALRERAATRGIPVIVYSGRQIWEADPGVFDRFVLKPAEPDDLVRIIRGLLAESRGRRFGNRSSP